MKIKAFQVNSEDYKDFLSLRAEATALSRKAEMFREKMKLPQINYKNRGQYVLVDENSNPIGKFTVSRRKSYVVSAGWTGKVS